MVAETRFCHDVRGIAKARRLRRLQKLLHLQVNESRLRLGKVRLKAQKSRTEPPLKASLDPQPFAFQPSNDLAMAVVSR